MSDEQTEILGSQHFALDGPFKLEMSVYFEVIDGENKGAQAQASFDLKPGKVPTDEEIKQMIINAKNQLGSNYRLCNRKEFVETLLIERTGVDMNFSIPGPTEFRLDLK